MAHVQQNRFESYLVDVPRFEIGGGALTIPAETHRLVYDALLLPLAFFVFWSDVDGLSNNM